MAVVKGSGGIETIVETNGIQGCQLLASRMLSDGHLLGLARTP